jgi:hypothetical protein
MRIFFQVYEPYANVYILKSTTHPTEFSRFCTNPRTSTSSLNLIAGKKGGIVSTILSESFGDWLTRDRACTQLAFVPFVPRTLAYEVFSSYPSRRRTTSRKSEFHSHYNETTEPQTFVTWASRCSSNALLRSRDTALQ